MFYSLISLLRPKYLSHLNASLALIGITCCKHKIAYYYKRKNRKKDQRFKRIKLINKSQQSCI